MQNGVMMVTTGLEQLHFSFYRYHVPNIRHDGHLGDHITLHSAHLINTHEATLAHTTHKYLFSCHDCAINFDRVSSTYEQTMK